MNVTITRAKYGMIVIGNAKVLYQVIFIGYGVG